MRKNFNFSHFTQNAIYFNTLLQVFPFKCAKSYNIALNSQPQNISSELSSFIGDGADFVTIIVGVLSVGKAKRLHKGHRIGWRKQFSILIKWNFKWQPTPTVHQATKVIHLPTTQVPMFESPSLASMHFVSSSDPSDNSLN